MRKQKTMISCVMALSLVLLFSVFLFQDCLYAKEKEEFVSSPLFEASLKNTLREFAEKESNQFFQNKNEAMRETPTVVDVGDKSATLSKAEDDIAFGIPGVPSIPSIPSYTSSYSCGATCGATCTATCNSTCVGTSTCAGSSTCYGTSTCLGGSTCAGNSTCAGTSTCIGSSTCLGNVSCAGNPTCVGTSTCIGTNTCAGTATCIGSSTCVGTATCFATGCNVQNPGTPSEPLPENPAPPVGDGGPSKWAVEAVNKGIELNLVPEHLQNHYQNNITREEYCELAIQFVRKTLSQKPHLLQKLDENPGKVFEDTDNYAVGHAYKLGIVKGVGDNKFEPNRGISRQEAAKLMLNFNTEMLGLIRDGEVTPFVDEADIADWAKEGVDFVVKSGLMKDVGDNKFAPKGRYTREQSIITMVRLHKEIFGE